MRTVRFGVQLQDGCVRTRHSSSARRYRCSEPTVLRSTTSVTASTTVLTCPTKTERCAAKEAARYAMHLEYVSSCSCVLYSSGKSKRYVFLSAKLCVTRQTFSTFPDATACSIELCSFSLLDHSFTVTLSASSL